MNSTRSVHIPQSLCHAGVARCDITPPVGMYHRMWGAATQDVSTGIHRRLTATALAIRPDDGGNIVMLIAVDHCILADEDLANIRASVAAQTSIAAQNVHVTLSHTHGAGLVMRDRASCPGGEMVIPYLDDLAKGLGDLARQAEQNLRPVGIVYAIGRCGLAADRDYYDEQAKRFVCGFNPDKRADDTVVVARIEDRATGRTIATMVNYACHPTTLAWANTLISTDYPGAMREIVEGATDGAPPCIFLQGALAELGPREQYLGDTSVADRNGRQLGYAALSTLASLPSHASGKRYDYKGPITSGTPLGTWAHEPVTAEQRKQAVVWRYRSWTLALPYRTDLPTLAQSRAERERLLAEEHAANERKDEVGSRELHAHVERLTRQIIRLEMMPPGDAFPLCLTAWQLGDAIWVFVAGEHYSALQTSLRARFPGAMILVTAITDGWQPGYLPTAETYGKGIYQETIAMVAPGALERVIEELAQQIGQWI